MLYLLDANVLITANHTYYAIDAVPEYWDWLRQMASSGRVKMPVEIYEELRDGPNGELDLLFAWAQEPANRDAILLDEEVDPTLLRRVIAEGYGPDLTDVEVAKVGRDPFLIAYALASRGERCVVTGESSKPGAQRANRRIPDVCRSLEMNCCNQFEMNRALRFRTNWRQAHG